MTPRKRRSGPVGGRAAKVSAKTPTTVTPAEALVLAASIAAGGFAGGLRTGGVVGACPDCAGRLEGPHGPSCPLEAGWAATSAADRAWFEARPGVVRRRRSPSWAEIAALRAAGAWHGIPGEVVGEVEVLRLAEDVRCRRFGGLLLVVARNEGAS